MDLFDAFNKFGEPDPDAEPTPSAEPDPDAEPTPSAEPDPDAEPTPSAEQDPETAAVSSGEQDPEAGEQDPEAEAVVIRWHESKRQAAEVIWKEISDLSKKLRNLPRGTDSDSIACRALDQFARAPRQLDNQTDAAARCYLRQVVYTAMLNELSALKRAKAARERAEKRRAEVEAARQRAQIRDGQIDRLQRHAPEAAEATCQARFRVGFLRAVKEMIALEQRTTNRDELITTQYLRPDKPGDTPAKARARMYALHSRTRAKLITYFLNSRLCAEPRPVRMALVLLVQNLKY
jgi:hypothetical protein